MAQHMSGRSGDNVRIGPISVITLIIVICMAVLAVLTVTTAEATMAISQRQADATQELYLNECAGQEFVAEVDDVLTSIRVSAPSASRGAAAVNDKLDDICTAAQLATDNKVTVTANVDGTSVNAEFIGGQMRRLNVTITILDSAMYRIDRWKTAAIQQEDPTAGNLWTGL